MPLTEPWWRRRPEWLDQELAAFDAAGISWERDEESFAGGVARLHLTVREGGEELRLTISYPDLYPYFRFEVSAPTDLGLHHHQHPHGGNLCLMPRGTERWRPSYTAAGVLRDRLADVLRTGRSDDAAEAVADVEQEQAEPYSDYYPYPPSMIIVQPGWQIPAEVGGGTLLVGTAAPQGPPPKAFARGAVLGARDEAGNVVAEADRSLRQAYAGPALECVWVRAPQPIALFEQVEFVKHLLHHYPRARLAPANRVDGGWLQVWGVLFPEEVGHRRIGNHGWVFACCFDEKRHRLPTQQIERQAAGKPAARPGARPRKQKRRQR